MDVRCERCRARYTFEEEKLTPEGVMVQCSVCGHLFLVKAPEPVGAAPARPEEIPVVAPPPHADPAHPWTIRQASGQTLSFSELSTLQRWIVERKVAREDEVTQGDGAWVKLGTLAELGPFFEVVEAADRAQGRTTSRYPPAPYTSPTWPGSATAPPAPDWAPLPPGPAPTPAYVLPPVAPTRSAQPELDEADLRAVGRSSRTPTVLLVVLLLLVASAAGAYVFMPSLFGRAAPPPAAVAPPVAAVKPPPPPEPVTPPEPRPEVKPADPEPPAARPPEPAAEPPAEPRAEPRPAGKADARPRPATPRQQLAEARRLREAGKSEQALDLYGRLLVEEPDNAEALAGRGLCYFDLDQYGPAEASLQAALRRSPTQPDALMGLAETCRAQGRKAEAIVLFERYLAAHPAGDEAAVARNAITQLKE